ncbi:hypothetical protein GS506_15685 [Rhodococcus hoagii]|nr:hypothetical protein [Prescottella equi]
MRPPGRATSPEHGHRVRQSGSDARHPGHQGLLSRVPGTAVSAGRTPVPLRSAGRRP